MTKPGKKPLPTALKEVKGTFRPDRAKGMEPVAEPLTELPACPDWLNEWAKDEWYTVVAWLHGVGLLSAIDVSIVATYCQQMGIFRQSEEELQERRVIVTDKGYEMPSPWVAIGNKALMQALKIATEYGLTPSSQNRIVVPKAKPPSRLQALMERRNK